MKRYKKLVEFRVEGAGTFPADMLRYDRCWPATEDDAIATSADPKDWPGTRQVLLHTYATPGNKEPLADVTADRWRSFSWTVTEARYI